MLKSPARSLTILSTVLLVIVIGGMVAACTSNNSGNTGDNPPGSSTTPKPTATTPPGFKKYDGGAGLFTILYPSDWQVGDGVMTQDFTGPSGQTFNVDVELVGTASPSDAAANNAQVCQNVAASGGAAPTPATLTINGQQWQQLDCGDNGTLHYVVETLVSSRGDIYSMGYGSPSASFANDKTQFFSVMEQSFTYL